MRRILILALALVPLVACSFDENAPGVRGPCGATNGEPLCPAESIVTGDDACWKLVQCGSIPIESEEDNIFDEPFCEFFFDRLSPHRYRISVACVAASTCDQLRFEDGPVNPRADRPERMPLCLEYGDQ